MDLTLAQTRQLRARERLYQRSPVYNDIFEVPTLAEYLELILNSSRIVGAYVETKCAAAAAAAAACTLSINTVTASYHAPGMEPARQWSGALQGHAPWVSCT